MECIDAIKTRRSVRSFLPKKIDEKVLSQIIDAARHAPSAGNLQPWRFVVVRNKELKEKIALAAKEQVWAANAAALIVVCADTEQTERFYGQLGKSFALQDCSAAIQNALLAAHALGLGGCWIGVFAEHELRRLLGIPENISIIAILALGYPAEQPKKPTRFELDRITYFEQWGKSGK